MRSNNMTACRYSVNWDGTEGARQQNQRALAADIRGVECLAVIKAEAAFLNPTIQKVLLEKEVVSSVELYANGAMNIFVHGPGGRTDAYILVRPEVSNDPSQ